MLLWVFATTGGRQIFVKEVLGGAYDSQAEHFLRGKVGVDVEARIQFATKRRHARRDVTVAKKIGSFKVQAIRLLHSCYFSATSCFGRPRIFSNRG